MSYNTPLTMKPPLIEFQASIFNHFHPKIPVSFTLHKSFQPHCLLLILCSRQFLQNIRLEKLSYLFLHIL